MTMTKDDPHPPPPHPSSSITTTTTTTSTSLRLNDTSSTPNITTNVTESFWAILERLNYDRAIYFLPAVVWVLLLMVVGVVGNALVIYVYRRRFKRTSSNYFILTMAVFDLVACLIGLPTEVYDLLNPFTFYSEFGCKLLRATENFTIYGSVVVLVEIAFDRYFKICRPLMMVSLFKIKVLCAVAVASAFLMAIPSSILFGINRINTPEPGIRGYDCSISETYRHTAFQSAYFLCLAVVFVITLVILTALYVRIWLELRQRRRMVIGDQLAAAQGSREDRNGSGSGGSVPLKKFRMRYLPSMSEDEVMATTSRNNSATQLTSLLTTYNPSTSTITTTTAASSTTPTTNTNANATPTSHNPNNSPTTISTPTTPTSSKRTRFNGVLAHYASNLQVSRTTVVLFAVTVAFVLSFFPALAVMVVRTVVKDFDATQSMGSLAVTKIFIKFSFINNAINPIIYSFLNVNFRRQARTAMEKMLCCFQRRFLRRRRSPRKAGSDRSTKKEFVCM